MNLLPRLFRRSIRTSSGYRFEHFKTISDSPRFKTLLLLSFLMCIGFRSKETAKGSAISSLETRDLEANAHAPNYSPIKARSSRAFKLAELSLLDPRSEN